MYNRIENILKPSIKLTPVPSGVPSEGRVLHGIKAAVFDIYGTLLISGSGDVGTSMDAGSPGAFKEALERAGLPEISTGTACLVKDIFFNLIAQTHKEMKNEGIPYPEVDIISIWENIINTVELNRVLPGLSTLTPETVAAWYEAVANPVYPMPGVTELMNLLESRGIRLGIISNAQFYTPVVFETIFPGGLRGLGFDPSLCLFSYIEKRSKPDITLFRKLSESLAVYGIKNEETIFIGNDMLNDIMPAASAGYRTVLFAGDHRSLRLRKEHDACRNIKPDVIVNKLTELSYYIQEGKDEKANQNR